MDRKITKAMGMAWVLTFILVMMFLVVDVNAADPEGPDNLTVSANETKATINATTLNISGGRIATVVINKTIQNTRWKGFVGNVTGMFTLDDSGGGTLYDWTISTITGRVYATREATATTWAGINCTNITHLETEDTNMNQTRADDNITTTFNATYNNTTNLTISGNHDGFWVGTVWIANSTCPTLNTYNNSGAQNVNFEEMALYEGSHLVYVTILESDLAGFDGNTYDFQMIVPEMGTPGFSAATAYYLYVEIGT